MNEHTGPDQHQSYEQQHGGQPQHLPQPYQQQQQPGPGGQYSPPQPPYYALQQPYPPQQPRYPQQVAPKSAGLAMLLSLFIPGLGTIYGGEVGWGIAILILWVLSWIAVIVVVGMIMLPIVWICGLVSAYMAAQRWNREHGVIS